jgi:Flp pilus assembly protein protease CpaA
LIIAKTALIIFLVWVSVHDIKHLRIENFTHFVIISFSIFLYKIPAAERLLTGILILAMLTAVKMYSAKLLGTGDIKLCGAFGFAIGTGAFIALLIGFSAFALIVGIRQLKKKITRPFPLAPFFCAGFAAAGVILRC